MENPELKSRRRSGNNNSIFLHIHAGKIHPLSLRWNYTFGLGVLCLGLVLFLLTLGLSFTGYLLPWDQLAYWAGTIGVNIAASPALLVDALGVSGVVDFGGALKRLLPGSHPICNEALVRF